MLFIEDPSEYPDRDANGWPCRDPRGADEAMVAEHECYEPIPAGKGPWAESYWVCTREAGHDGLHVAHIHDHHSEAIRVIAVWGEVPDRPRWEIVES